MSGKDAAMKVDDNEELKEHTKGDKKKKHQDHHTSKSE